MLYNVCYVTVVPLARLHQVCGIPIYMYTCTCSTMSIADKVLIKAQYTLHAAKNMKKLGYNELKAKEVCLHLQLGQGNMYIIFDRLAIYT